MNQSTPKPSMFSVVIGVILCLFTLVEVNFALLSPQPRLAFFAMFGLILVFHTKSLHPKLKGTPLGKGLDWLLIAATVLCFGYVAVQTEPLMKALWVGPQSLGDRAGIELGTDYVMGLIGLFLILEGARRAVGLTLPLLALTFIIYAAIGPSLPDWLFPHRGYDWQRIVGQTFLHSQGAFGIALKVMFTYVFLFVIFGALLERTGATEFIITFARNLFQNSAGGPAKVSVISSGMMGSLSGSAVANTATTGTFTIPMMRSSGFTPVVAGGVEAAASSGGALVPPVMGAGAYMMLELVEPAVTFLEIVQAAAIPAVLYYTSLLLTVHLHARKIGAGGEARKEPLPLPHRMKGVIFFGAFLALIALLIMGRTAFRAVSVTLVVIVVMAAFNKETRLSFKAIADAFRKAAMGGVALVAAAACVGIVIGVVTLTGLGSKLPAVLLPLAQENLILGLIMLMISTIILGMGLPSAVCYLLMATLVGPVLGDLGVVPLAAHLFIFYFGMMSMVTPPVALAAYAAGTIAGADIMKTGLAAFRFALIGFALPFAFVLHPELLMLSADGQSAGLLAILGALIMTLAAIIPLAAGISGFAFTPLNLGMRLILVLSALSALLNQASPFISLLFLLPAIVVCVLSHRSK